MDNKQDKNNLMPTLPPMDAIWASWSVFLGIMGIVGNCTCTIWSLPGGLILGLLGVVCAVMSKKGKPFTQQALLGLILSIIAAVCGLLMALATIFMLDLMKTDTPLGIYARQLMEAMEEQMQNLGNAAPAK